MEPTTARRDIHGNIAATPVANMLHTVRERKLTGRGTFSQDSQRVDLAFRDGQIVHAAANDPDLRLGEVLLSDGVIGLARYNESVAAMLDTGKRQGEIFLEREWLTPGELAYEVRRQMKRIIYGLMHWESGTYLYRWTPPIEESILLDTSIYKLILRGMRLEARFSKLRDYLAPWHRIASLNTQVDLQEARTIRLREDETTVLGMVDGKRRLDEIIAEAPFPDLVVMQILYGLVWSRILRLVDPDEDGNDPFELERMLA